MYGYALYKNGQAASVKYPLEGQAGDVAGRSFHHGRFVMKLRKAAASQQGVTMRQGLVKKLINAEGGDWEEGQVWASSLLLTVLPALLCPFVAFLALFVLQRALVPACDHSRYCT